MHRVITVVCASICALAPAAPAHASGAWQPAVVASGSADPVDSVDVAIGTGGHAAVVWGRYANDGWTRTIHLRRRTPAGVWGPVENVSTPYADPFAPTQDPYSSHDRPSVDVDANGNTLVTWVTGGRTGPTTQGNLYLEAYAPAGQPIGAQRVFAADANGSSGAAQTDVHFGPSGEALVTWLEVDAQFRSIVRAPDGTWGPETVIPKSSDKVNVPYQDLSYGRDGTAVLAWSEEVHATDHYIDRTFTSVRRPGGTWSAPQLLQEDTEDQHYSFQTQVGVALDGSAIVAFNNFTPAGALPGRIAALPNTGSTFGPSQPLPEVDAKGAVVDVVAHAPGTASILGVGGSWTMKRPFVAGVTADGTSTSITTIGDTDLAMGPLYPRLAGSYDAAGGLHLLWSAAPEDRAGELWKLYRTYRPSPDGDFDPITRTPDGRDWVDDLSLAAGAPGDAVAAWSAGDRFRDLQLFVSVFESSPAPSPTPAPAPTTPSPAPGPPTPTSPPAPAPPNTPAPTTPAPVPTPPAQQTPPAPGSAPAQPTASSAGPPFAAPATPTNAEPSPPTAGPTPTPATAPTATPASSSSSKRLEATRSTSRCTIPDVRGLTVAQAKRRLERAHCKVGRIRYVKTGRAGRVVRQNTPGAVRAAAFPVVLVVARNAR